MRVDVHAETTAKSSISCSRSAGAAGKPTSSGNDPFLLELMTVIAPGAIRSFVADRVQGRLPAEQDAALAAGRAPNRRRPFVHLVGPCVRVGTGLQMPDCFVMLAAEGVGATVASFDLRLNQAAAALALPILQP